MTAAILLVAGGLIGWNAWNSHTELLENEYRQLEAFARYREARIRDALHTIDLMLTNIGNDLSAHPKMPPAQRNTALAQELRRLPELRNLLITDADGKVIASNNEKIVGFDASDREYFQRLSHIRDRNYSHISRPFKTITGITVVTFSRPILDAQGRFLGVIAASINPKLFESVLQFATPTPDGLSLLINEQGDIIYRVPGDVPWEGKNLKDGIGYNEHMASGKAMSRHLNKTKLTGRKVLGVFSKIPGTPLITIGSRDYDSMTRLWRQSVLAHGLAFLIVAATTLALSAAAARRQKALAHSERRFRSYFELPLVGIAITSPRKGWIEVNDRLCEILGRPRETLTQTTWTAMTHPDDLAYDTAQFERVVRGEIEGYSLDKRFLRPDGSVVHTAMSVRCMRTVEGAIDYFVAIFQDISARKSAETQLANALEINRSVIDHSPVGIVLFHADGPCVQANQAFADLIGGTLEEARTLNFRTAEVWRRTGLLDAAERALREYRAVRHETDTESTFGKHVHHDCNLAPLILDGQPHLLLIVSDIADFRAAEDALRTATRLAEEANRAKSEFLANMSHEIRTPMNAVMGLSQLGLSEPCSPKLRDYLEKIHGAAHNLLGIINDILDFSKIEAGRMSIENALFSLDEVLDGVRNIAGIAAANKGVAFAIQVTDDVPVMLTGDPLRLGQVLNNLAGNAVKFTEQGSVAVSVRLARKLGDNKLRLAFAVADTGIGIAPEQQQKLFQAFVQTDGTITRRFGGTGLGLAISRRLVELMGGDIAVVSTAGKGSTFSFEIELSVPTEWSDIRREPQTPDLGTLSAPLRGKRILVVEDNAINVQVVCGFLAKAGCQTDVAENGIEALALLERESFDAVLMDVDMPVLDGLEATRRIRALGNHPGLPIIALTASVLARDRQACLEAGMDAHLGKPIDARELIATLAQFLSHPATAHAPATGDPSL